MIHTWTQSPPPSPCQRSQAREQGVARYQDGQNINVKGALDCLKSVDLKAVVFPSERVGGLAEDMLKLDYYIFQKEWVDSMFKEKKITSGNPSIVKTSSSGRSMLR